jgi:hypothetical protein
VHLDIELGALADAQEVDVQRLVLDGIELVVARNDAVLLAINIDSDDVIDFIASLYEIEIGRGAFLSP